MLYKHVVLKMDICSSVLEIWRENSVYFRNVLSIMRFNCNQDEGVSVIKYAEKCN